MPPRQGVRRCPNHLPSSHSVQLCLSTISSVALHFVVFYQQTFPRSMSSRPSGHMRKGCSRSECWSPARRHQSGADLARHRARKTSAGMKSAEWTGRHCLTTLYERWGPPNGMIGCYTWFGQPSLALVSGSPYAHNSVVRNVCLCSTAVLLVLQGSRVRSCPHPWHPHLRYMFNA